MAFANKKSILPATEERRRFQRVKVHLLGRYMLPDRREFPCQIINMSPGGLALLAPGIGNVGDRVIAYLDHIGRGEGKITRMEEEMALSYPTIRNRLQEVIRALGYEPGKEETSDISDEKRRSILEQLDSGSISAEEAMGLLNGEE